MPRVLPTSTGRGEARTPARRPPVAAPTAPTELQSAALISTSAFTEPDQRGRGAASGAPAAAGRSWRVPGSSLTCRGEGPPRSSHWARLGWARLGWARLSSELPARDRSCGEAGSAPGWLRAERSRRRGIPGSREGGLLFPDLRLGSGEC